MPESRGPVNGLILGSGFFPGWWQQRYREECRPGVDFGGRRSLSEYRMHAAERGGGRRQT